jgi:hypothetical protein
MSAPGPSPEEVLGAEDLLELWPIRGWLRLLAPDDAADVLQHVPSGRRTELLAPLDEPTLIYFSVARVVLRGTLL